MDNTADMITRIRNAIKSKKPKLNCIYSIKNLAVLKVMKDEGYIEDFEVVDIRTNVKEIVIALKYKHGVPSIRELKLRSRQQRREYVAISDLDLIKNGLGIAILSTSLGVISDHEARQKNVGGEVICEIF